jgi:spermidine synthase
VLKRIPFRRDAALFWISCFMLFFEILMIRWLSAEIRIFAYFHNLVLLFCFLGIGLGCALAGRRYFFLTPFVILGVLTALIALDQNMGFFSLTRISQYLSLGTGFLIWYQPDPQPWYVRLMALIAGNGMLLFLMGLVTLFFVPFGQILGKLLNQYERPLRGYAVNLVGSLAGIWLFNGLSYFSLPPIVWVGLGGVCCLVFLRQRWQIPVAAVILALSLFGLYEQRTPEGWSIWSPYQKLTVEPVYVEQSGERIEAGYAIYVNNVGYMQIIDYSPEFQARVPQLFSLDQVPYDHYNIPYRFTDKLDDVLIVGPGAGNDVAGALRNGAKRVVAVEIDPVIIDIGRELHPEDPYGDPTVVIVNDDARSFFKKTEEKYDLVVFGLLDSHTLSSSYSNVRLDNYVYTQGSFEEVMGLLKPHGILVLIFEVSDEFIGARIQQTLAKAVDQEPTAFFVRSGLRGWGGYGFATGNQETIAQSLEADPVLQKIVTESQAQRDAWAAMDLSRATDDWPYLYLRRRSIPLLYFLIFGWLLLFSYWGISKVVGRQAETNLPTGERYRAIPWWKRMDWHFFFLGAGFLLLEVQNISKLALLFGTTWTVNAIVISAVLFMGLLANTFVIKVPVRDLRPYYVALFITLLINLLLPMQIYAGMSTAVKALVAGTVMALPIFFAGIIFSSSYAETKDQAGVFASNLFGAMVGGILECASFIFGIKSLLVLTAVLYLLSMLVRRGALAGVDENETARPL